MNTPVADKRPQSDTRHGITRIDDYAWLRADNWQDVMRDPELLQEDIRSYLEAENAYQKSLMSDTDELQVKLFAEMKGRIKEDDSSVPSPDGAYSYGIKYVTGGEQPKFVRTSKESNDEQMLLDGDKEAENSSYFRLASASHSPDHRLLAWAVDDKGSEFFTMRLRNLINGVDLDDVVEDTAGGGVWSKDSKQLFYTKLDENHRPSTLFSHKVGSKNSDDKLIYEEADPGFFMGVGKTQSGNQIIIDIHDHQTSECWHFAADEESPSPVCIAKRQTEIEYSVDEGNDIFYILTNVDGSKDFKIVTAPVATPGRENWQDLVPHETGRLILSHTIFARHLVWLERRDGLPRIVVREIATGEEHAIAFDEEAYSLGMIGGYEFDTNTIRFSYSSMTTPNQTFDYDMVTRERNLLKTQEVPSGHNSDDYVTKRIFAASHDGKQVPVSLLYRADTPLDGTAPCLLYGYGSYGMSIPASFSTNALSLVDRGMIYAIAHIRGGMDKGFQWYEDGKRETKLNTFKDFISVGEHLINEKYTSRGKIIAQGGSAGGMLMGAVSNMTPDLFGGIIAEVPFVDVLNTMLDETLPLTPPEWPEWGNPIESKSDYDYIANYSPYDQVSRQDYPPIFAVGGLTDPRVTYWEPAKWVAKLRTHNTSKNPIMLKTNMEAGHGGASGRFARLEEVAIVYAFALKVAWEM
jgi:oligopeptidase B